MSQIEYSFEEIALSLGKNPAGKHQNIGLITGTATINVMDHGEDMDWEIDSVTLEGPILHDPDVVIDRGHPLFDFIADSISSQCGDRIWDSIREDAASAREGRAHDRWQQRREERLSREVA